MKANILLILFIFLFIAGIGYADYITGVELSFSIFYLIPISILSLDKKTSKTTIIIFSFFASFLWFAVENITNHYSQIFFPIWNASVRFFIFVEVGLLLHFYRQKQASLICSNVQLQMLNEEKNRLLGIAAHDLRSPINGIYGLSDILLHPSNNTLSKEHSEIFGMIKKLSENMLTLIKNILDVSQIESGQVAMTVKTQDYVRFIKEHIHLNQLMAKKKISLLS